jgi:hypothetical protein
MSGKKTSQNAVVTLYERVRGIKIETLLSAKDLDEGIRMQLKKYYGMIKDDTVEVKYYFSKNLMDKGRLYADKSLSLQNFKKEIRHYLARDDYIDIDMVNAHPTIIYQYCKKHNIECSYLEYYVNNREDLLSKIQTRHEIDRDAAKKLILRLVYLGDYVIEKDGSVCIPDSKVKTVTNFQNELIAIAKQICIIEKETYEMVKKDASKLNKKSTVLSITAQIIKHKCLMT